MTILRLTTIAVLSYALLAVSARADTTDLAGGGQGIPLAQPSLAMNYIIRTSGDLDRVCEVIPFAGNFAPFGWSLAQG